MTKCKKCKTALKLLFSSWYCPNDCDRKQTSTVLISDNVYYSYGYKTKKLIGSKVQRPCVFKSIESAKKCRDKFNKTSPISIFKADETLPEKFLSDPSINDFMQVIGYAELIGYVDE